MCICFLVALLCLSAFSVSAFATGYIEPVFTMSDGTKVVTYDQYPELFKTEFTEDFFTKALSDELGYDITDYYYFINVGRYSIDNRFPAQFGVFDKNDGLNNNTLYLSYTSVINYNSALAGGQGSFFMKLGYLQYSHANNEMCFRYDYNYNGYVGLITNIPNINYGGEDVKNDIFFNYAFSVSNDYIGTMTVTTNSIDDCRFHVSIYNQSAGEPSEATKIPYAPADEFVQYVNANNSGEFQFDLQDFKDKCSDMKSYSEKIIISGWCMGDNDVYNEKFFYIDLTDPFSDDNPNKALFAEKKDYISFPDLEDYLYSEDFPDIRDYVDFDMFDDVYGIADYIIAIFQFLWSCLSGFFVWMWAVLKFIFFNFVGLIRWLGACLWTIVQNIAVALYNLVVDLRRLVIYLFVPERDELDYIIKEKAPSLTRILSHIQAGKSSTVSNLSFSLFGKEFNLNFAEVISADIRLTIRNASTLVFLALQALVGIRKIYRIFGIVGGSDDTSLGGETH